VDYENLAKELIRALRGRRTQPAFSKRLGYRSNVVYAWECGRRWPTASDFLRATALTGRDVTALVQGFMRNSLASPLELASIAGVASFLDNLRGRTSIGELARSSRLSRYTIARWLNAKSEPRLPDFLRLVDATSHRLLDFVSLFVDPLKMKASAALWAELEAQRAVAYEFPWSHAVMRLLELESYRNARKHQRGWIAKQLGISIQEEIRCLDALAHAGNIEFRGRRWVPTQVLSVDTGRNRDAGLMLRRFWAQIGLERMNASDEDLFAHNLFTVSAADLDRVRQLFREYFRALRTLAADSSPAETLVVANVQLFALRER
jgi:transcriptional regulator with XRE-family HTH domain